MASGQPIASDGPCFSWTALRPIWSHAHTHKHTQANRRVARNVLATNKEVHRLDVVVLSATKQLMRQCLVLLVSCVLSRGYETSSLHPGYTKACIRGKTQTEGAMARARYYVECIGADRASFEYTYYHFAPAFFFARDPEHKEKQDFIQLLVDRYHPQVMAERSWGCISCGRQATDFVHNPTYSLSDAAALAVNTLLLAVCPARACHIGAATITNASKKNMSQEFGLDSVGPEMLMCRN